MRSFVLLLPFCLVACEGTPASHAEKGGAPADYDAMNEVARGAGQPIEPQPIRLAELQNVAPFNCLVSSDAVDEVFFLASPDVSVMQIEGELIELSPVPSAQPLPYGISDRFDGKAYRVELVIDRESKRPWQPEWSAFTGRMTVRDEHRRVVYDIPAQIRCGADG